MPKDQTWRPLDAKQNELDCILWISHSQGNGVIFSREYSGNSGRCFWFSWFLGVATGVQSLGHPDASCPAMCRVVLSQTELPHILQDFQMSCWKCRSPKLWLPEPCFTSKCKLFYACFKKTPSFLLSCKSRENVFFNALPRIVCLVLRIMGPSPVAQWLRL